MRLLLDVHHTAVVAERLQSEGHDVAAAVSDRVLSRLEDEELLLAATAAGRSVVTENVADFDRIARSWGTSGKHHAGIVFTSRTRYHRGGKAYPGNLIAALRDLLATAPESTRDRVFWLR